MSLDDVMAAVDAYGCSLVELTGGEPLLQKDVYPLMERLLASGKTVLVETGGHLSLANVPPAVHKIMDVKCPGSGEAHRMDWSNLDRLSPTDEVKFVIRDRADYEYARDVVSTARARSEGGRGAFFARSRRPRSTNAQRVGSGRSASRARPAPGAQIHLGRGDERRVGQCEVPSAKCQVE